MRSRHDVAVLLMGQVIVDLHDYLMYEQFDLIVTRSAKINWQKHLMKGVRDTLHAKKINFYPIKVQTAIKY